MRIQLKRLVAKNIMSVGNKPIELPLSTHKKNFITGKNGSGKSTLLIEALTYALFGKPYRKINKPQLVNSVNKKGLLVELTFEINEVEYLIRRGISPGIFEIFKDGEQVQESAAVKDFQEHLEKNILKVSYKTFKQIVVLGTAGFSPFMTLSPGQRREVVEDLLDIEMFSSMVQLNREKLSTLTSDVLRLESDMKLLDQKTELIEKHANENAEKIQEQITDKERQIGQYTDLILKANIAKGVAEEMVAKLRAAMSDGIWMNQLSALYSERGALQGTIKHEEKLVKFFGEHDHCPTCTQAIDSVFKEAKVNDLNNSICSHQTGLTEKNISIKSLESSKDKDDKIAKKIQEFEQEIVRHNANVKNHQASIDKLEAEVEKLQKKTVQDVGKALILLKDKIHKISEQRFELMNDKYCHQVVANILKDNGVKAAIINQYMPVINKLINHYLTLMGASYQFELDSEFNETIRTRGKENFSYTSFSQGERYRIDLAILFTWRSLIKMKSGSSFNILVMDEVMDSAADQDGIDALMGIIDSIDDNVFIISHNDKIDSLSFDRKIDVQKIGNFSGIVIS